MISQEISKLYSELKNQIIEVTTKVGISMVGQWLSLQWNDVTKESRVVLSVKEGMNYIPAHSIQSIIVFKNGN